VVKVKVKYSKKKYRPVSSLLDVNDMTCCKCKLQLKFSNNTNSHSVAVNIPTVYAKNNAST
jgi:hypothetical protein